MESISLSTIAAISAAAGVASHLGYFIHGEHHLEVTTIFLTLLFGPPTLCAALFRFGDNVGLWTAIQITSTIFASYLTAITASILTYRALFHPLRNFPGPYDAKLSKITHSIHIAKDLKNFKRTDELHKQYGDIVRIGPNELSLRIPAAVNQIAGPGTKCGRSIWYDCVSLPNRALQTERNKAIHDRRRKVWDRGFSARALRDYEPRIKKYTEELVSQLAAHSGEAINAGRWFNFFSFDVMGDLAFGKSFDMLQSGKAHFAIALLNSGMASLGILTPIAWIFPLLRKIPGTDDIKFIKWSEEQVQIRKQNPPELPDIMSWLIEAESNTADPVHSDPRFLNGDSRLIIVAGSDTTAATLTHVFYHLCASPSAITTLRQELADISYTPGSENEVRDLQDAKYLDGIIHETLRLHPPVPSGLTRVTPPEGLVLKTGGGEKGGKGLQKEVWIPGGVTVSTPTWSMGRLESCYVRAEEWLPERWVDKPELMLDKSGYAPFSVGPYSCIGRVLALQEMRTVIARVVTEFDVKLAPGEDGRNLLEESRDCFTLEMKPLNLVFDKIKKKEVV